MPQSPTLLRPVARSSTTDGPIVMSLAVPNSSTSVTLTYRTTTGYLKYGSTVKGSGSQNVAQSTTDAGFTGLTQTLPLQSCDSAGNPTGQITELRSNYNFVTGVNVSQARGLVTLDIQNANLGASGIDLSNNPSLETLILTGCQLTALTLTSTNAKLAYLKATSNLLTSCNLSALPLLYNLDLQSCASLASVTLPPGNALQTLFLANCPALTGALNLSGRTRIQNVYIGTTGISPVNVSGCTGLSVFNCDGNGVISTLDFTGCTALSQVQASDCADLEQLILTGCSSLNVLYAYNNPQLSTLTLPASAPIGYIIISNTAVNSLSLTASNGASLNSLGASGTQITSLNLNACAGLKALTLNNSPVTSLRAVGVVFDQGKKKQKGTISGALCSIAGCQLNAAALDQFYTDLGETTGGTGFLFVGSNPGTTGDNPGIATGKNYVVFGT